MAYYKDIVTVNGEVKCILCDIYIPEEKNYIDLHINDEKHIELYIKRIMMCNNISMQQGTPYCFICNIGLCNMTDHITSTSHKQNMDKITTIIEKDGAFLELPTKVTQKDDSVHCTICDIHVSFTLMGIKQHIQSINHKRARAMAVQPFNGIFSVEGTDHDLWCKICQLYFENYVEIIFEHVDENDEHVRTLNKILKLINGQDITIDKYLTNAYEDKATCNKCGIEVPCNVDNLERHVKGKRHKNA